MSKTHSPWSSEAEQSVLGALLMDNSAIDRITELRPEHFFDEANRIAFVAIVSLLNRGKPADVITAFERIEANGESGKVGGLPYLNALSQAVPSSSNIARYAGIVMERAKARALMAAGSAAIEAATDQTTHIDERIEKVSAGLMRLLESDAQRESTPLHELLIRHTQMIEDRDAGKIRVIPTGLHDLDEMLGGGVRPGNLVIIAGRPSMGKTAAGLTIAMNMASTYGVEILSMEMSEEELGDRALSLLGRIDLADVQRPPKSGAEEFWTKVADAAEDAAGKRLHADDQGGLTLSQVRAKARAAKRKNGIDVLVVDYLQLMSGTDPKQSRTYQLEEITRGLKALAKELGIAVIALAQVNRRVEGRGDSLPGLSDLKDSGAIEQDADVVVFIHRPIQINPSLGDEFNHYAKFFLAKNRQGRTGLLNMAYIGHETRFTSWSGQVPDENRSLPTKGGAGRRPDRHDGAF